MRVTKKTADNCLSLKILAEVTIDRIAEKEKVKQL